MFEVTASLKVREGQLDGFKRQAAEMMRLAKEEDTKTLRYDWFLSDDGTECEVREVTSMQTPCSSMENTSAPRETFSSASSPMGTR